MKISIYDDARHFNRWWVNVQAESELIASSNLRPDIDPRRPVALVIQNELLAEYGVSPAFSDGTGVYVRFESQDHLNQFLEKFDFAVEKG